MNAQYEVMGTNINYTIIEDNGKMWLQVYQGKTVVKFPITKSIIATLNWHVNGGDFPENIVLKY